MINKIKQKIISAWKWVKAKFIWLFLGGVVLAAGGSQMPAKIPAHLQLKAPVEKILLAKAKGNTISYLYASDKKVLKANGEDISKRTKNAQFFPQGEQTTGKFFAGEPFYKDGADWFQTETATTTKASFEEQTKVSLLDKVLGKKVFADSSTIYAGAGDGYVGIDNSGSNWNTVHDATTGSGADYTASHNNALLMRSGNDPGYGDISIQRVFIPIDTSALPDNAVISEALLKIHISVINNTENDGNDYIRVVQTDQPSNTALTTADYNNCGATDNPTAGATDVDFGTFTDEQYNTWILNATGRGWISLTGYTKLGMREGHDVADDPVDEGGGNQLNAKSSEQADTTYDPKLEITYTTGGEEEAPVSRQDAVFFE